MIDGLRARGWGVGVRALDDSFPRPTGAALKAAAQALAEIPDGALVLIDGLALGAMPSEVARERHRLRLVALVHMPLAADVALEPEVAARFEASERLALEAVACAVATGESTRAVLAGYGVPPGRIALVEPGTERGPLSRGSSRARVAGAAASQAEVQLLSVATITLGKGYEILLGALVRLTDRSWHLTCVGSVDRDPQTVDRLRAWVREHQLASRVSFVGEQHAEALDAYWDSSDVFVQASLRETYGMAVAEALAHGLPVVATTTGAIPALVGAAAGVLVPPGDVEAMSAALSRVLDDPAFRRRLADGAREARERLPSWEGAFDRMATVLERVMSHD
jgi:glycosyltransferase involved in cell wall biosynthesis